MFYFKHYIHIRAVCLVFVHPTDVLTKNFQGNPRCALFQFQLKAAPVLPRKLILHT